jgi:diguanylate cyclase (GGDEF)-like protein
VSVRQAKTFSSTITIAIIAMIVVSSILTCAGIYVTTQQGDEISAERQARSARHAMDISVDELALQQETVAIWDEAAAKLATARPDRSWAHDNMGIWLHNIFRHDEVLVLDGSDRPVYAAINGNSVPLDHYRSLIGDLRPLLRAVRGHDGGPNGRHDRNPNLKLHPKSSVRTTSRATHDSHIVLVGGRPAAASAMLIQPSTPNYMRPNGHWPVLISVRYLDAGFLTELSARQLISGPRFSLKSVHGADEQSVPIQTEWGGTIGYLVWKPELPGTQILWKLVPLTLLVLAALASFMVFLGRRLRRSAAELTASEERSSHQAYHDALTGLANRAMFQHRLDELNEGTVSSFALALIDLDDFKLINDTLGHDSGDALLLAVARRLQAAIAPGDLVARLGGDEFALLLMGTTSSVELEQFGTKLLERLTEPFEHQGKDIRCHASIGATMCQGRGGINSLLKHADLALYEAKAAGRCALRLYSPAMWSHVNLRRDMLTVAASALEGDFFEPYYQPKVDLQTDEVVGFEALLRCCVTGEEARGPDHFAAAFEDPTLALKLSDRLVDGVIHDISMWRANGLQFGHVAINAALAELRRGDFADRLLAKLERAAIPPECIQVEVTESVLLGREVEHVERNFAGLTEKGVKLALDDFGTGFASLTHLKRFPIEIIKIDRSFVRDLQVDPEDGAIVDALIGLGRALGIQVVAEGIETKAQRDFLAALGCSIGQGYLFGAAIPARETFELLRAKHLERRAA